MNTPKEERYKTGVYQNNSINLKKFTLSSLSMTHLNEIEQRFMVSCSFGFPAQMSEVSNRLCKRSRLAREAPEGVLGEFDFYGLDYFAKKPTTIMDLPHDLRAHIARLATNARDLNAIPGYWYDRFDKIAKVLGVEACPSIYCRNRCVFPGSFEEPWVRRPAGFLISRVGFGRLMVCLVPIRSALYLAHPHGIAFFVMLMYFIVVVV